MVLRYRFRICVCVCAHSNIFMTMIKKTISLLIAALAFVHASASNWQVVPSFLGSKTQNVVDMGDEVYYLVSGSLYRFDKSTKENESLNRANYLNDVVISNIYYNDYRGYLMVVYDNSNIDIITSEGDIINLPEIKAASLAIQDHQRCELHS